MFAAKSPRSWLSRFWYVLLFLGAMLAGSGVAAAAERPNFLWLTCEDISPYLGAYGDPLAHTPHLDRFAKQGILYTQAYANAPVCAVARSTLLTGMHSPSIGTHQMRSRPQLPPEIPAYSKLFRQAGYYCTNNVKTDYNSSYLGNPALWDESSNRAHYRQRAEGQPFFAVFNDTQSHESRLDRLPEDLRTRLAPEQVRLPPFHPDLPEMRQAWARLYELISRVDAWFGQKLAELEKEGEAENTIVFFYADHGGMLAGTKRYLNMPGTRVPLIVRFPQKWQHLAPHPPGSVEDRVVSFVDFPKTVLSLAGIKPPPRMQGRIFLGPDREPPVPMAPLYRDRMAERYDFCRGLVDGRHFFVRNFMPHRPPGRDSTYGYMVQANWGAWREHYEAGKCDEIQSRFFQPKPQIELYDVRQDPWNVNNLATRPEFQARRQEFDQALDRWMIETRDIGLIPEPLFYELVGPDQEFATLYEYAQSDAYPVERVLAAAKSVSEGDPQRTADYVALLQDEHPAIRHWGAYGLFLVRQECPQVRAALKRLIGHDTFAGNRIMAAQALAWSGDPDTAFQTIYREADRTDHAYVFLLALNAFQYSHTDDRLTREDWERYQQKQTPIPQGPGAGFAQRMVTYALENWPARPVVD